MKKILSIFLLASVILISGCSTDDAEPYVEPPGEEEPNVEDYRNKFVVVNGFESDLYLIKHEDTKVVVTETIKPGEASKKKGSNENQATIVFRLAGESYPDFSYFETVEAPFTNGASAYKYTVTLENDIYQITIKAI